MSDTKISLLGASGSIGKTLVNLFNIKKYKNINLYVRNVKKMRDFISQNNINNDFSVYEIGDFENHSHEVIINAVGVSSPKKLENCGDLLFRITEGIDNRILSYLEKKPKSLYINFSSGAIYNGNFCEEVGKRTSSSYPVNNLDSQHMYSIVKLNSEAKHRCLPELNIVDLRVFSFFTRFVNLNSGFFMAQAINSIRNNSLFEVTSEDIVRDYVHPLDLMALIELCINSFELNTAFDVVSARPVKKMEILEVLHKKYGLKYKINQEISVHNASGDKNVYFSGFNRASEIGYFPKYTSVSVIKDEAKFFL